MRDRRGERAGGVRDVGRWWGGDTGAAFAVHGGLAVHRGLSLHRGLALHRAFAACFRAYAALSRGR
ncbi:hypothetical protein ACFXPN_30755 [Streptomyces griseorubiginosus]|uniref:hypothetical protein n=1 Tax=Streptomyces griseorubiginosus TaxID=67304 RepID=UPI00367677EE